MEASSSRGGICRGGGDGKGENLLVAIEKTEIFM